MKVPSSSPIAVPTVAEPAGRMQRNRMIEPSLSSSNRMSKRTISSSSSSSSAASDSYCVSLAVGPLWWS